LLAKFIDGLKSRWKAQWNDSEGKKKTKSFSINKYGEKALIKTDNKIMDKINF